MIYILYITVAVVLFGFIAYGAVLLDKRLSFQRRELSFHEEEKLQSILSHTSYSEKLYRIILIILFPLSLILLRLSSFKYVGASLLTLTVVIALVGTILFAAAQDRKLISLKIKKEILTLLRIKAIITLTILLYVSVIFVLLGKELL